MSIKRLTTMIVVIVSLVIVFSIGVSVFLISEFNQTRHREQILQDTGWAQVDFSSVLSEYLFIKTPRGSHQLNLAKRTLSAHMEDLATLVDDPSRMALPAERLKFLSEDLERLFLLETDKVDKAVSQENLKLFKQEIGGQLILTSRELSGYLSAIEADLRRDMAEQRMALIGSAMVVILIISMIIVILIVWMRRRLLLPVFALHRAAAKLAAGDYASGPGVPGIRRKDEIGELAASFETMRDAIRQHVSALAESEENLRTTLDSIGDAVIATDTAGRVVRMNPVAEQLTGWRFAEARDRPVIEVFRIINSLTRESVADPVSRVLETGRIVGLANHTALISRDGREMQIADSGAPIRDDDGNLAGVVLVFRDVTEAYTAQQQLRESNQRLKTVMNSIDAFIYIADMQTHELLFVNEHGRRVWGEDIIGQPCWQALQALDGPCPFCTNDRLLTADGRPAGIYQWEFQNLVNQRWYDIRDSAIQWTDGRLVRMEVAIDITERKQIEEVLRQSEERYKTIVSSMSDLIFVVDEENRFVDVHYQSTEKLLHAPEAFLGKTMAEVMPPEVNELYQACAIRVRGSGKSHKYEYHLKMNDQDRWFVATLDLHTDGRKIVAGIRDITERKQAEEALARTRDELAGYAAELEHSNRELEDFAYIASHDLKEPLRGIHNYSSFLLEDYEDQLDTAGQSKLHTLMRLTRRLELLLDDLLRYSRVGQAEPAMRRTDTGALVRQVLETMESMLEEHRVTVTVADNMPSVMCDPARVGEVFRNLITNAVKYNDQVEKEVVVGWEEGDKETGIVFFVQDNGIGIAEKHFEKIFKIFKRLHGREEYGGGTGSGLTLARKIIERHGGTIWVTSEPGQGSTFRFTLPRGEKND